MVKKILLGFVGLLVIVIIGFFAFVNLAYDSSYDADYPITEMTIEAARPLEQLFEHRLHRLPRSNGIGR